MKNNIKQKKGISLIVLVITIIVMIILATAIILAINGSGIIGKANEARTASDNANKKQAASVYLGEYIIAQNTDASSIEGKTPTEYVQEKLEENGVSASDVAVNSKNEILVGLSKSAVRAVTMNIQQGAVISYNDFLSSNATSSSTLGNETATTNSEGEVEAGTAQTVARIENATWRYMGISSDGKVLIAPDIAANIPAENKINLKNQGAVANAADVLDTICGELYTTEYGKARSMDVEDVINILGYKGYKGSYIDTSVSGNWVRQQEPLTIGKIEEQVGVYLTEDKSHTPDPNIDISEYKSDFYQILKTSSDITAGDDMKNVVFQSGMYWLASPFARMSYESSYTNNYVFFGMRMVSSAAIQGMYLWSSSNDATSGQTFAVRPVIELSDNVTFEYDDETDSYELGQE